MRAKLLATIAVWPIAFAGIPAIAANFLVDTTSNDLSDVNPGDGECAWSTAVPVGQRCTLRAAVAEANALPGADSVVIPDGTDIVLSNGPIAVTTDITVGSLAEGEARPVIDADFKSQVFVVSAPFSLLRVVVQHGRALGIANGPNWGGAIETASGNYTLSIEGCDLLDNAAGAGGAVLTQNGEVQIVDSTFAGNSLDDPRSGGVLPFGIALWNDGGANLTIERSTFSGNVSFRNDAAAPGAAITAFADSVQILNSTIGLNPQGGLRATVSDLLLANTTVSNNGRAGIGMNGLGAISLTVRNSIIADNEVGCVFDAPFASTAASYSLDEDGSCGFVTTPDNLIGVDPKLGPLADNGGPTKTNSLLPGSPARDAGDPAAPGGPTTCLLTDQRGIARPQPSTSGGVARCDMGAVEVPEPRATALAAMTLAGLMALERRTQTPG
jgi:hypothetical protein